MAWLIVTILALVALGYAARLVRAVATAGAWRPRPEGILLGAVTNFFDTLGIGSFAPSIAWLRFRKLAPDRLIPLTMLGGYILPSILQGVIFMILLGVRVDPWLIVGSCLAMVAGGVLGVPLAARAPIALVQAVVGLALLVAAFFLLLAGLDLMPAGGTATSLALGPSLLVVAVHLVFGLLIPFGVGNYAPTLVILSILGMDPRLAFPIMASAAGLSGAAAASRSLSLLALDLRLVLGLALGAIPAVLIAAFVVKELPLDTLRWLVVAVVTYAGLTLLWTATRRKPALVPDEPAAAALL